MTEEKICLIEGCGKPVRNRGYCNAHYLRLKRNGDPLAGRRSPGINNCKSKECPAAKKIWAAIHYLRNQDLYKTRSANWRINNKEVYEERIRLYLDREDIKLKARERTKEWNTKNPDRKREMDKKFYEENRSLVTSYKAKYRAAKRQATPKWLTREQENQIRAVYAEARRLTLETGTPYEVDHIVPLAGKIVSGLHVPWNLRAIPKIENNTRPRIYIED